MAPQGNLPAPDLQTEDVGRLIGKHGAQIKAMREQSQCQINVESTERPIVNLKGTSQQIAAARRLIAGICGGDGIAFLRDVDDFVMSTLTRGGWLKEKSTEMSITTELKGRHLKIVAPESNPDAAQQFKAILDHRIAAQSELTEESIPCDTAGLRRIKEDSGIKQLEVAHHLKMDVRKNERGSLLVLRGQRGIVDEALQSIKLLLGSTTPILTSRSRDFILVTATLFDNCSEKKMNDLKSDILEGVEQRFGVHVEFERGVTKVVIEGTENAVYMAKEELELMLQYYFNENCAVIAVPISAMSYVCGNNDQNLARLQSLHLAISVDRIAGRLWICGSAKPAGSAYTRLTASIQEWKSLNIEIPVSESRHAGFILGQRGENIRRLQNETKAIISIDSLSDGSQVARIQGATPEITQKGKLAIEQCLRNADMRRPVGQSNGGHDYNSYQNGNTNNIRRQGGRH